MDGLYALFATFGDTKFRYDDDRIDRINRFYTPIVLILFCALVSTYQYVGDPVICWLPKQISDKTKYVDDYCWISNTYYLPLGDQIPHYIPQRENLELAYYQWVPFMLLVQALMCYLPCAIWRAMNFKTGLNLKVLVDKAIDANSTICEDDDAEISALSGYMDHCLTYRKEAAGNSVILRIRDGLNKLWGKTTGNYLFTFYLVVKLIYIINAAIQLIIINAFLKTNYIFYGIDLLIDLINGNSWKTNGRFPRVTMCDFEIRVLGNLQRHTVQCVLPINMFNEKIYIAIWFWLLALLLLNIGNFIFWIRRLAFPFQRRSFVKKYIPVEDVPATGKPSDTEHASRGEKEQFRKSLVMFVRDYMKVDGVFTLHLICSNTNQILIADLVKSLWERFLNSYALKQKASRPMDTFQSPKAKSAKKRNGWLAKIRGDTKTDDEKQPLQ